MEALSVLGRLWFPVYKNQVVKIISVFLKLNFTNFKHVLMLAFPFHLCVPFIHLLVLTLAS